MSYRQAATGRAVATGGESPDQDKPRCAARDCPNQPSVNGEHGHCCRYHGFAETNLWPMITEGLREHDWLIGLIRDLGKVSMYSGWRSYATQFWHEAEPAMVPAAGESREMYLYRLHLSLAHRVGARKEAPEVLKPAGSDMPKRRGNLGELLGAKEAVSA